MTRPDPSPRRAELARLLRLAYADHSNISRGYPTRLLKEDHAAIARAVLEVLADLDLNTATEEE